MQMSDTNTFGRIPVDQTIEETVNKDTQTAGTLYQVFKNTTPRLDQYQHFDDMIKHIASNLQICCISFGTHTKHNLYIFISQVVPRGSHSTQAL